MNLTSNEFQDYLRRCVETDLLTATTKVYDWLVRDYFKTKAQPQMDNSSLLDDSQVFEPRYFGDDEIDELLCEMERAIREAKMLGWHQHKISDKLTTVTPSESLVVAPRPSLSAKP